MSEHPNVALHRKAHAAFSRGDMDMLTQMIAEDTVWHSAGKSLISGDFRGREAVLGGFFAKLDEVSGGTAKFVEHQALLLVLKEDKNLELPDEPVAIDPMQ